MSEERGGGSQRGQGPGYPSDFRPIVIENYAGINTQDPRPAISDNHFSVCDGWMPVGPKTLRVLPDIGPDIYTSSTAGDIVWIGEGNIGDQLYFLILHSNGSLDSMTYPAGTIRNILSAGTVSNPRSVFGFSQWGSQYILFSSDQTNGYWLWDGTNTYTAGTVSPIVDLSDGGQDYTSAPTVLIYGGSGTGAAGVAQISAGSVTQVTVTAPGGNYELGDHPLVVFSGGNGTRTPYGAAQISNGVITSTFLQSGGGGYQNSSGVQMPPTITITDPTGSGAIIVVSQMAGGIVVALQVVAGGLHYSAPVLSFSGTGSGAAALAFTDNGVITGITMIDAGLGLTTTPTISFVGPTGAGAVAMATIDATGAVSQTLIQAGGKGYTDPTYAQFSGGNGPAVGTIEMMPFGVSGTWIETYQGHGFVGNGAAIATFPPKGRVVFSAGGSPVNFGADGGAFLDTNSFARVGYHSAHQVNGFLYLIGDSSLDYISGITPPPASTSGVSSATITFNQQNSDPQIGSPWPSSSIVYSRNIALANTIGVYISSGGSITKISHPLDGIYQPSRAFLQDYPSAVANIFGHVIYMLLVPVLDTITDAVETKLIMWDGDSQAKPWFTSRQSRQLTYITTLEQNSVLQAFGTDGTHIFQLFAQPSTGFTKTFQTKLYSNPAYWVTKTVNELWGVTTLLTQPLAISVDNELAVGSGGGSTTVAVSGAEFDVFGPLPVGQHGSMLGLTVSTNSPDGEIVSLMIAEQDYVTRI